jgi:hypothetical protein
VIVTCAGAVSFACCVLSCNNTWVQRILFGVRGVVCSGDTLLWLGGEGWGGLMFFSLVNVIENCVRLFSRHDQPRGLVVNISDY